MTGWALLAALAGTSAFGLWTLRVPRVLASFVAAALALAGAGYAWQGRPGLAGQPAQPTPPAAADPDFLMLRSAMFGRYGAAGLYLTPSDALQRIGASGAAATLLQGALSREPGNVMLWTELGNVIAAHDAAVLPAALFAYRQAVRHGPIDPAPWFFLGMAQIRAGEFLAARAAWRRALQLTPSSASFRSDIALRLALLDRLLATEHAP